MYETIEQRNALYADAIKKWGWNAQVNMAVEELAECIVALQKVFNRDYSLKRVEDLASEVADVTIMMEEVKLILDQANPLEGQTKTFSEMVSEQVQYKLERTRARIDKQD